MDFNNPAAQDMFDLFDHDNSGTISFLELCTYMAFLSRASREEKLLYAFDLFDTDKVCFFLWFQVVLVAMVTVEGGVAFSLLSGRVFQWNRRLSLILWVLPFLSSPRPSLPRHLLAIHRMATWTRRRLRQC